MSDHMTHPHDEKINRYRAATAVGQAHWAGTGPDSTKCLGCAHASFNGYYAKRGAGGGNLKPIGCLKYRDMMGHMPKYDGNRASCRFFEPGDGPPKKSGSGT